jgi:hypothetical protein
MHCCITARKKPDGSAPGRRLPGAGQYQLGEIRLRKTGYFHWSGALR